MSPRELSALKFWNAAVFIRRAPDRDRTIAYAIIDELAMSEFTPIRNRAEQILKDFENAER